MFGGIILIAYVGDNECSLMRRGELIGREIRGEGLGDGMRDENDGILVVSDRRLVHGGGVSRGDNYFHLHDRLGSVRQVIDTSGNVKNRYIYEPFGELYDNEADFEETIDNSFKFTGQYLDSEIDQYYLRARQYYPHIGRSTTRDPILGSFREPMTLHVYLYCLNDPVNRVDPSGEFTFHVADAIITGSAFYGHAINLAAYGASCGDWRFFDLAAATGKFMKYAMGIALIEPLGPLDRIATYFGEGFIERTWGSRTGFTWGEALAVDVAAYAAYYGYMSLVEKELGIDVTDMMSDFIDWKKNFWR